MDGSVLGLCSLRRVQGEIVHSSAEVDEHIAKGATTLLEVNGSNPDDEFIGGHWWCRAIIQAVGLLFERVKLNMLAPIEPGASLINFFLSTEATLL